MPPPRKFALVDSPPADMGDGCTRGDEEQQNGGIILGHNNKGEVGHPVGQKVRRMEGKQHLVQNNTTNGELLERWKEIHCQHMVGDIRDPHKQDSPVHELYVV